MEQQLHAYCLHCAKVRFRSWRGWPNKNAIPLLPRIVGGTCELCGLSSEPLMSNQIQWINVHGEFSTGLPDYWVLAAADENNDYSRWGQPYFAEGTCPKCGARSIISEHSHGRDKLVHNCEACGIRKLRPSKPLQQG